MLMQGEREMLRKWHESEETITKIERTVDSSSTNYTLYSLRKGVKDRTLTRAEAVEAMGIVKFLLALRNTANRGQAIQPITDDEFVVVRTPQSWY